MKQEHMYTYSIELKIIFLLFFPFKDVPKYLHIPMVHIKICHNAYYIQSHYIAANHTNSWPFNHDHDNLGLSTQNSF